MSEKRMLKENRRFFRMDNIMPNETLLPKKNDEANPDDFGFVRSPVILLAKQKKQPKRAPSMQWLYYCPRSEWYSFQLQRLV